MVACFMFPISCNVMSTELGVSGLGKVPVDITTMCTELAASGEDERRVCTCYEGNKQFCYTVNFDYNKLIGNALKCFFVEKFRRIMRDIFRKKHKITKRPFNPSTTLRTNGQDIQIKKLILKTCDLEARKTNTRKADYFIPFVLRVVEGLNGS